MNLLEQYTKSFYIMDKRSTPDGFGGVFYDWVEGMTFDAAIMQVSDTNAIIAQQNGAKTVFKLMIDKHLALHRGDRIKQANSGETYTITSDSEDMQTPPSSAMQLACCTAERVEL